MKTIILCGGLGTRIRDVTDDRPKPMVSIGGSPILWHIMKYYAHYGYKDFVLCLGHQGNKIKEFFINYDAQIQDVTVKLGPNKAIQYHGTHDEENWAVTMAETGLNAMTGARVRKIRRYVADDDTFFLTYGDGVGTIDLNALYKFHRSHGKVLTVTGVRPPGRFGELDTAEGGVVTGFNEKPQATAGLISGGFFVCDRRIFDYLDDRDDLVFEQEPMRALVRDQQLVVYQHDGFWLCMDTHRDWKLLDSLVEQRQAPWVVWE